MRLPDRLIEAIGESIVEELANKEKILELDDPLIFKKKIIRIFKDAIEEEKKLEEKAKEVLKQNLDILEKENIDYRTAFLAVKKKLAEEMDINIDKRERLNQIINRIMNLIMEDESVEIYEDPPVIRRRIREIVLGALKIEEEIEREVRKRIKKYSRDILEGSPEWNILWKRIYEDELRKRGLA
ncbi:MAG TPA: DUF507 family protein [Aquificaceae bacterium]|nr:DUF507 family protein [Aquificaceae bacterium]HIQ48549.1 DUF507 family protein [Aquifex aeolicus]